jgi:Na+-transporting NADH:ubiquinone oxidoreductase subunit C|tara:strand:- start:90 stop:872 length:783 start_codon:yes stop_codon:yes gene_type:complete
VAKNSVGQTFGVALLLCVVCSVLVSGAAVTLRPTQEANKLLDKKQNILMAAGLAGETGTVDELFENIQTRIVDLETGEYVDDLDAETYDFIDAATDPTLGVAIAEDQDRAGIKRRARSVPVYLVQKKGQVDKVILPIYGKGLWSTLYGFVALDRDDLSTIRSLLFYEHGETPGLGGEVDNPSWKGLWNGKQAYGSDGSVRIQVVRGAVDASAPGSEHRVDGLSGATITARGVHNMLQYWLSEGGYKNYLDRLRAQTQGEA